MNRLRLELVLHRVSLKSVAKLTGLGVTREVAPEHCELTFLAYGKKLKVLVPADHARVYQGRIGERMRFDYVDSVLDGESDDG